MSSDLVLVSDLEGALTGARRVAERYREALDDFLGQRGLASYSEHTRAAYTRALREFHEWQRATLGKVLPPHEVRRAHVSAYLEWLAAPTFRLSHVGVLDQPIARVAYEVLRAHAPGYPFPALYARVSEQVTVDPVSLHRVLSKLAEVKAVQRYPKVKDFVRAQGCQLLGAPDRMIDGAPAHDHFRYRRLPIKPHAPTTIAQRVSALSTWWTVLSRGENGPGGEPLVTHNVWDGVGHRVAKAVRSHRPLAAEAQRIDPRLVAQMVDHCLEPTEGLSPVAARDRALLLLLALSGLRVNEALTIQRRGLPTENDTSRPGWMEHPEDTGRAPHMVVSRKGGKKVRLAVPMPAWEAWQRLQQELAAGRDADRWLATDDQAPAYPALRRWGAAASTLRAADPHLTRKSVEEILRQIAADAALPDHEVVRMHPHALRHFFAEAAVEAGVELRDVQAMLSHASVTTTERYLPHPDAIEHRDISGDILASVDRWSSKPRPVTPRMTIDVPADDD